MTLEFVAQSIYNRGSNSPFVARTVLQTQQLIQPFPLSQTVQQQVLEVASSVMGQLIGLDEVRERVVNQITEGKEQIVRNGLHTEQGSRFANLPSVINLKQDVETFLYKAKLALGDIAGLFEPLYGRKTLGSDYRKFHEWAKAELGHYDALVIALESDKGWIEKVIHMRNAVEHHNAPHAPLSVQNFQLLNRESPWKIVEPAWFLKNGVPAPIAQDLNVITSNLLTLFEDILMHGLLLFPNSPCTIVEVLESERDPECPMRLTVVLKQTQGLIE